MNLFFDEESQKLIINAKKEMYELKHPYVGSEHLFLAILHSNLEITHILNTYGINYDDFKSELIRIIGIGTKENTWFLFTPLLRRIINNASFYSNDNKKIVTPYNLLVSILGEGDGIANRILINMNIDIDKLNEEFVSNKYIVSNKKLILDELGINMNKSIDKYDPVIGREKEINDVIRILLRKNKNNPLLIGDAGVGKTAIVEELARRVVLGQVPYKLKNVVIYSVSMSVLVAGTKYRGEFEEKINKLLKEVVDNPNIILFVDEIHTLMGAGGAEGAIDASNIIKPYLARGNIKLIGATTIFEYNKFISNDKALDRRFQKIYVNEASKDSVLNILNGLKSVYEDYHGVVLRKDILKKIVDYSYTCIFKGKQPDKAIDLLDEVCSYATLNNSINKELLVYESNIKKLEFDKNKAIRKNNFKKALMYKNKEMNLRSMYNDILINNSVNKKVLIRKSDIEDVIKNKVGFNKISIMDIDNNIKNILEKYDYIKNNKSLCILLVSKNVSSISLLVSKIVKNIYNCNYIEIDMNEYKEYSSINRLIGYKDGYILESLIDNPFSIILFKNIDNGNKRIVKFIFDSIDRGYIENSRNEKINISKCIIFMSVFNINKNIGFDEKKISSELFNKFNHVIYLDKEHIEN